MAEEFQERQVAIKTKIESLNEGKYVTQEGWKPNYLLTKMNQKISRVNLMGVIVNKETRNNTINFVLDDGSNRIDHRSFENIKNLEQINIGDTVLVIGKIRIFNETKYIAPEIVKKIDKNWLKVRGLELGNEKPVAPEPVVETNDFEKSVVEIIRELDKGDGVLIEEVKEKLNFPKSEEMINKMLEEGEIFQNVPGKVKVL